MGTFKRSGFMTCGVLIGAQRACRKASLCVDLIRGIQLPKFLRTSELLKTARCFFVWLPIVVFFPGAGFAVDLPQSRTAPASPSGPRQRWLLDSGWKFHLGDAL